ncbi:5'-nucleotidase [Lachnospiraceae bacterium MD1]|jgi:5'-nucleotidase|uniref:5'-nucleotidase n=1 Tax=Variimorphobacter saccharofermentans TaxID=2755051 RepID=A0A839JV12_9FIRM|nr:5'-nucleotidase [Variimorphobacter saccharofermentans]MBB2181483.1 5'-nucleotidase [Variimorphobacter saccharofermentans]
MPYQLNDKLVIGISSRALFDLEYENQIFMEKGLEEYTRYEIEHENDILKPGTAFSLIQALLNLNTKFQKNIVEVIIISRNSPETGLRVFNSIDHLNLGIERAGFTGGEPIKKYLAAFHVDLFLSKNEQDVQDAIDAGFAAALIYNVPKDFTPDDQEIRIAFDGDAVIFSEESEEIYQRDGLEAFLEHEKANAEKALPDGPFARLLRTLSTIKKEYPNMLRIAIITARNNPAHKRVILTLRQWGVDIDEAFFLGGVEKKEILKAFNAHIFFDDQDTHLLPASSEIPSGRVPYKSSKS